MHLQTEPHAGRQHQQCCGAHCVKGARGIPLHLLPCFDRAPVIGKLAYSPADSGFLFMYSISLSLQPLTQPHSFPAGLGAHDAQNGEHILQTHALPRGVPALVTPFVTRGVQLFQARQLPQVADGRASGGPLDLKPLLALPALQAQVRAPPHAGPPLHLCCSAQHMRSFMTCMPP